LSLTTCWQIVELQGDYKLLEQQVCWAQQHCRASCQHAFDNLSTSWEQAVRMHPVDKLLEQHCYKSAAGLLQLCVLTCVRDDTFRGNKFQADNSGRDSLQSFTAFAKVTTASSFFAFKEKSNDVLSCGIFYATDVNCSVFILCIFWLTVFSVCCRADLFLLSNKINYKL
jgi:hypothetical protein